MLEWIKDLATVLIPGAFISAMAAWLTVRLSLKRFRLERFWGKKWDAYSKLIESLHDVKLECQEEWERLEREYVGRTVKVPKEVEKEIRARQRQARYQISKASAISGFIFSERTVKLLEKLTSDLAGADRVPDYGSHLSDMESAIDKCLIEIREAAREDLTT